MGDRSIEERVIDVVVRQLGGSKDKITRETSFAGDLYADSLDEIELIMELGEKFDIYISDNEAEKILTVGQAIDCVGGILARETMPAP